MWNINARFRRLRRLCDSYMDGMSLGELEELLRHIMSRREVPDAPDLRNLSD